jgi:methyl-accepting chemotaxis protein
VNLNEMKIGTRLTVGFGLVIALMFGLVGVTYQRMQVVDQDTDLVIELQRRAALAEAWGANTSLNAARALAIAKSGGSGPVEAFFAPLMKATSAEITQSQEELTRLIDSEGGKAKLAVIAESRQAYVDARQRVLEEMKAGNVEAAEAALTGQMMPKSAAYQAAIADLAKFQTERVQAGSAEIKSAVESAQTLSLLLLMLAAGVAVAAGWLITRSITSPLRSAIAVTDRIAGGDLSQTVHTQGRDEVSEMQQSLARMQEALATLVGNVRSSSDSIGTASVQIASGNLDLSARTEQTASNLQQAASSLEQLTGTVSQTADSARTANQLAASASEAANRGGAVVGEVVSTMEDINTSSKKIADIIGTIDGIAFQTNILALNAAVEAARAGEQGRGFAVVASEVRSLAQRSAEAAKEIKGLIQASVERVDNGTRLVQQAGTVMGDIVGSVQRVTDVIGEISAATSEQTTGLRQVNEAVAHLDQMTQQNAALVEESAAAAESLADQSRKLTGVVGAFRTGSHHGVTASYSSSSAAPAKAVAQQVISQVRKAAASPAKTASKTASKVASKAVVTPRATSPHKAVPSTSNAPAGTANGTHSAPAAPVAPAARSGGGDSDWETF